MWIVILFLFGFNFFLMHCGSRTLVRNDLILSFFLIFFCEDYIKITTDSVYNYRLFSLQIIFTINYYHFSIILSVRSVVLFKGQSYWFSIKILVSMHFTVLHDFLNWFLIDFKSIFDWFLFITSYVFWLINVLLLSHCLHCAISSNCSTLFQKSIRLLPFSWLFNPYIISI